MLYDVIERHIPTQQETVMISQVHTPERASRIAVSCVKRAKLEGKKDVEFFIRKTTQPRLRVKRIHPNAKLPEYAHDGDSGLDVYSIQDATIPPGESLMIHTGLKIACPDGHEAQVRPRSGLALKHAITVLNAPGTVDNPYRGEVCVILINHGKEPFQVKTHDKIAQLVIAPVANCQVLEVEEFEETPRGEGGFGSTGV